MDTSALTTLITPDVVCDFRGHPIGNVPGQHFCSICTIIWRLGGDRAVKEARDDPWVEIEWLAGKRNRAS